MDIKHISELSIDELGKMIAENAKHLEEAEAFDKGMRQELLARMKTSELTTFSIEQGTFTAVPRETKKITDVRVTEVEAILSEAKKTAIDDGLFEITTTESIRFTPVKEK